MALLGLLFISSEHSFEREAAMKILELIPVLILFLIILGLVVICIDRLLHPHGYKSSPQQVCAELKKILEEGSDGFAFDDFISIGPFKDPQFEAIRQRCAQLPEEFPPESDDEFFGPKGAEVIREFIRKLEREATA